MKMRWLSRLYPVLRGLPYRTAWFVLLALTCVLIRPAVAQAITVVTLCNSDNQTGAGTNLNTALAAGGLIRFNCPAGSAIHVTSPKEIRSDTIIDGLNGNAPITLVHEIPSPGDHVFLPIFEINDRGISLEISDTHLIHPDETTLGEAVQGIGSVRLVNVQVEGFYVGVDATLGDLRILNSQFTRNNLSITYTHNVHQVIILNSRFIGNSRGMAGSDGIFPDAVPPDQQISVGHSLFVDNSIAVQNCSADDCHVPFVVTVSNSILAQRPENTDNQAFAVYGRSVRLVNSTILGFRHVGIFSDHGGEIYLSNTLVANNGTNCQGVIIDEGTNLQFPNSSCGLTIPSADPLLGQFLEPPPTSPATNAGDNTVCAGTLVGNRDFYYQSRPRAMHCSIGAVEGELLNPPALPPLDIDVNNG